MIMAILMNTPPAAPANKPIMKMMIQAFEHRFTTGTKALRNFMKP